MNQKPMFLIKIDLSDVAFAPKETNNATYNSESIIIGYVLDTITTTVTDINVTGRWICQDEVSVKFNFAYTHSRTGLMLSGGGGSCKFAGICMEDCNEIT